MCVWVGYLIKETLDTVRNRQMSHALCAGLFVAENVLDQGHIRHPIRLSLSVTGSSQLRPDTHALVAAWEVTRMAVLLCPEHRM